MTEYSNTVFANLVGQLYFDEDYYPITGLGNIVTIYHFQQLMIRTSNYAWLMPLPRATTVSPIGWLLFAINEDGSSINMSLPDSHIMYRIATEGKGALYCLMPEFDFIDEILYPNVLQQIHSVYQAVASIERVLIAPNIALAIPIPGHTKNSFALNFWHEVPKYTGSVFDKLPDIDYTFGVDSIAADDLMRYLFLGDIELIAHFDSKLYDILQKTYYEMPIEIASLAKRIRYEVITLERPRTAHLSTTVLYQSETQKIWEKYCELTRLGRTSYSTDSSTESYSVISRGITIDDMTIIGKDYDKPTIDTSLGKALITLGFTYDETMVFDRLLGDIPNAEVSQVYNVLRKWIERKLEEVVANTLGEVLMEELKHESVMPVSLSGDAMKSMKEIRHASEIARAAMESLDSIPIHGEAVKFWSEEPISSESPTKEDRSLIFEKPRSIKPKRRSSKSFPRDS